MGTAWLRLVLVIALALPAAGCSDDVPDQAAVVEPEAAELEPARTSVKPALLPPQLQATQDALRAYSACLRRTAPRVHRSWGRYRAGINPETGRPARRTDVEPFIHRLELDLAPCRSLPTEGSSVVDVTADEAMQSYVEAVQAYAALTERLAPYYDAKAYKDDGWALGEELAPQLTQAFETWSAAATGLSPVLRTARDAADAKALEALANADAPPVHGVAIAVGRDARALRACFDVETPEHTLCEPLLAAVRDSLGLVDQALESPSDATYVFWIQALSRTTARLISRTEEALAALRPARGRPKYKPHHRDAVLDAARHVEDVADNVRFGL